MNVSKALRSKHLTGAFRSSIFKTSAAWVRPMSGHYSAHQEKPFHFDDVPVPAGKWEDLYNKNQKKYNLHLFLGVAYLTLTIAYIAKSGIFILNSAYPPLPELEENK